MHGVRNRLYLRENTVDMRLCRNSIWEKLVIEKIGSPLRIFTVDQRKESEIGKILTQYFGLITVT